MTDHVANFAAIGFALYAAHQVGDHWGQTSYQAAKKGGRGAHAHEGRMACLGHVASLTTIKVAFLVLLTLVTGLDTNPLAVVLGLAIDAGTHYWADRRFTLAWLAGKTGKAGFYGLGAPREGHDDNPSLGTGAYALDQSFHIGWLFVTALILSL